MLSWLGAGMARSVNEKQQGALGICLDEADPSVPVTVGGSGRLKSARVSFLSFIPAPGSLVLVLSQDFVSKAI